MKNEPAASQAAAQPLSPSLSQNAFRAFFETLESPAALCDTELRLLVANAAFEVLCGVRGLTGKTLGDILLGAVRVAPPDGGSTDVDIPLSSGQSVTLTLSRRGETVAVLARNLSQGSGGYLAAAGRALMEQARVEEALLLLGRELAGVTSEEALVAVVARGVRSIFPGRTFCVRIADPKSGGLTSLYAEGRLREGAREAMVIKRSAATKTQMQVPPQAAERVRVQDGELPLLFVDSVRGVCAPLVASGQLFGVLNVEYPPGISADLVTDDRILTQLANQVAVSVRNAKLIDELTFVRKYLEELLENANALILVVDRERKIIVFNRQLAQRLGLQKVDVLGKDLFELIPEGDQPRVLRAFHQSLRGEAVSNLELHLRGPGDLALRGAFATSSVLTAEGEVEGVIAIGQDLTAMKELERRFIQAEKLATLGQLAASVVHEINNPMTAVTAYADAMLKRTLGQPGADPADQEKLRKILDASERVLRFTRDLVSYARPARDRPEKVDLHRLIERAISLCDHVLVRHGVRVERRFSALPPLLGVPGNLVQVFVNLVTNACHAMQPGGVVTLETERDGDDALIRVRDAGCGIAPAHLPRLFEPFFTTKADGQGTGLGLSIVHGIIESHGGEIDVKSELARGTTFTLRLPLNAG